MARLIIIILFSFFGIAAIAQDTVFIKPERTIAGNFTDFAVDNVGNIYLVIEQQQLKKINPNGDSVAVFNDIKRYGKISSVDATNPFKILLYFRETSTIVILDRLLNVVNKIDLRKNNLQQVQAIRLSYDNNIWLYDELESKIKKIDDNGNVLLSSVELRNVFDEAPVFQAIFDEDRSIWLYDSLKGWFVFDYYGAFTHKYPLLHWKDAAIINGTMFGRRGSSVIFSAGVIERSLKQSFIKPNAVKAIPVVATKSIYVLYSDRLEVLLPDPEIYLKRGVR